MKVMKARICEFCGKVVTDEDQSAMVYEIAIEPADEFIAKSTEENAVLFRAEDACISCASRVQDALKTLQKELSVRRRQA